MIIIGLDPGIGRCGYALLDATHPRLIISCGRLTTPQHLPLADRLANLGNDLTTLITAHQPHQAVVEEIYFGKNAKTAMMTAQARGVLLYILRQHRIPITTLTPLQIKSHLTGYGKATKQQIQALVQQRLRLDQAPQDDAADAVAAALYLIDRPKNPASTVTQQPL